MRVSTLFTLLYLISGQYIVYAAYIRKSSTTTCTSDLDEIFKDLQTIQTSLNRGNIFQARHDYERIQESVEQARTSCCLLSRKTSSNSLQSIEMLSKHLEAFLLSITTKIQDSNHLLLRVVASMELEQLPMSKIQFLDACLVSSAVDTDTYVNHTYRLKNAFSYFKTALSSR